MSKQLIEKTIKTLFFILTAIDLFSSNLIMQPVSQTNPELQPEPSKPSNFYQNPDQDEKNKNPYQDEKYKKPYHEKQSFQNVVEILYCSS